eukprot:g76870.t1
MITHIAHDPGYVPTDPTENHPTFWVTFYTRKGATRCCQAGDVPDPAVPEGRLVVCERTKAFPQPQQQPRAGAQSQVTPKPRQDTARAQETNPKSTGQLSSRTTLREPTQVRKPTLPPPEHGTDQEDHNPTHPSLHATSFIHKPPDYNTRTDTLDDSSHPGGHRPQTRSREKYANHNSNIGRRLRCR